jgi:homoserine/homoserine lactone efflux protein
MTFDEWLFFTGIWFAAGLPLGPNAVNCISISAAHGIGRALWAVVGILIAGTIFMAAVVTGLGAVLLANGALFTALKLAGAAYLIWMGVRLLRSREVALDVPVPVNSGALPIVKNAILISFSNPKAMISCGAVFSQFIAPEAALAPQLLVIVPTALAINAVIYMGYSALGLGVKRAFGSAGRRLWFNRGVGGFYILAGTALAASEVSSVGTRR